MALLGGVPMIARRSLLTGAAALAAMARLPKAHAANGTIPGAIRWDAWYGGGAGSEATVNQQVANSLGPQRWQFRAPWFAQPQSAFANTINGNTQAIMDAEIGYAASAGLKYWAYVWYGQESPASPMMNAWNLHQSSSAKSNMNWCMILSFSRTSSSTWAGLISQYVAYFQQANYQQVLTNRPLFYLFIDNLNTLNTQWGGSWATFGAALTSLRTAATGAGLGSPYIVFMYPNAVSAASFATQASADGISSYLGGGSGANGIAVPWATFEPTQEAFWTAMGATGTPFVPNCVTGFDLRPRLQTPPNFSGVQRPWFGANAYVLPPTGTQLTAHLQAAVSYIVANPTQCPSKAAIIYSWDECDEGGNAIIPTYGTGSGPDTGRITALQGVTW